MPISKNLARDILGWDVNKKYIIYLGKLYRYKQPLELIEIWKEIKKTRPEVELVILGNSEDDEYYHEAVNSGAIIAGRILNKDLYVYYSAADVYVLIALRDDYFGGIGIAPIESLACNTPVVSYALRNYIGNNTDEIGEMPKDLEGYKKGILKVLDNPGKYKNMRESVKKHYSYKAVSLRMYQVFEFLNINRKNKL
jgi:glycosyltransferase involved in cell wall biosynthesis